MEKSKAAFIGAFNSVLDNKDELLAGYGTIIQALTDTTELDRKSTKLQNEAEGVTALLRKCVEENAHTAMDQEEYLKGYAGLVERYEKLNKEIAGIDAEKLERNAKRENIEAFIRTLRDSEGLLTEFDESLWVATVDKVVVLTENDVTFTFKDGLELDWKL